MRIALVILTALGTLALGSPAGANSMDNQLSLRRNELLAENRKVGRPLADVEHAIETQGAAGGVTGSASAWWAVRATRRDEVRKLQVQRHELRRRQAAIERKLQQLTHGRDQPFGRMSESRGGVVRHGGPRSADSQRRLPRASTR